MSTNAIAKRYAKALVQIGSENGAVDQYNAELSQFSTLLSGSAELTSVFANPAYGIESKSEILKELVQKVQLSPIVSNLLHLLLERGRITVLPQIAESYSTFADLLSGVIRPTLTSGLPLEASQVEEIRTALATNIASRRLPPTSTATA